METNLKNRVVHTSLPKAHGLFPLYEAIINSIHAIDEAGLSTHEGRIDITILRSNPQTSLSQSPTKPGPDPVEEIHGFEITDNGIGFNDANMKSFETLDSDYKASLGCFGVGRILWLKAFSKIKIESYFKDGDGSIKKRSFNFDSKGISQTKGSPSKMADGHVISTKVRLGGFIDSYRDSSKKTSEGISKGIFEHCLWYFLRPGGAPYIFIHDGNNTINLDDIKRESLFTHSDSSSFNVKGKQFEITHIKLKTTSSKSHHIGYCAAGRLVREELIRGKIPGIFGRISENGEEFVYSAYVTSPFLDSNVRTERFDFDLAEEHTGPLTALEISFSDIRTETLQIVAEYLSDFIQANKKLGQERVENFVNYKAPRYKSVLHRMNGNGFAIDPDISDKDLDIHLHKLFYDIERDLISEGHDIMNPLDSELTLDYKSRLDDYLSKVEEIKQSDLASYVSHRKVVIDLLQKAISINVKGRYSREELIHHLLMPLRKESTEIKFDHMNLWLVDERLAFHDFLASDKTLLSMPITDNQETKEPDIVALQVYDTPILVNDRTSPPLASITVIELKRPMRNDMASGEEKDPIDQIYGYVERIRNGTVKTKNGRLIPNSPDIPAFGYVIADLTETMIRRCNSYSFRPTADKMGYFGYNDIHKIFVEVISFDRLVNMAKERNRAFFDKLGLPNN
ncbi:MAG TPA: hypothetical protein VFG10_09790 [Saprospiraceae bacterium]|nr:hypothetical protein [Saprospiraceae bacterium]